MLAALKKNIIERKMVSDGDMVVVGVSGGRDSVALLHALKILSGKMGFYVVAAHFNHGIRALEADLDQVFVEEFCRDIDVQCHCLKQDIPALAAGANIEAAARRYRYDWLRLVAAEYGRSGQYGRVLLATAHHLEDQGETVLLHLLHGAGTGGLGGMKFINGEIIRPLLNVPRSIIEAYIEKNGLSYRDDMSNFQTDYQRNRIRLELWPQLQTYNSNLNFTLGNTAEICGADSDFIMKFTLLKLNEIVRENSRGYYFEKKAFDGLHLAVKRKLVRILWRQAVLFKSPVTGTENENLELTLRQTSDILDLGSGKQISLPREVYAKLQKGRMYIGKLPQDGEKEDFLFTIKKNTKNK
ncbi:MAG: tRNA lysidine(34) synthetase TilS [Bacillota bacterium]|jgi:tRNA(Ile)-lysidine synthase